MTRPCITEAAGRAARSRAEARHRMPPFRAAAFLAVPGTVFTAVLAAVSAAVFAAPVLGADPPRDAPSIKALFEQELVFDGRNVEQQAYQQTVDACRQAGLPIRALSDEQLRLLGVTTIAFALDADRRYSRVTEHSSGRDSDDPGAQCLFTFRVHVRESRRDRRAGTAHDSADPAVSSKETPTGPDAFDFEPLDERNETRQSQDEGWFGPEIRTIAGESCNAWQHSRLPESMCVWTGGARWGLTPAAFPDACPAAATDPFRHGIALEVEPTTGIGCRLRTVRFSSGKPLDDGDFEMKGDGSAADVTR